MNAGRPPSSGVGAAVVFDAPSRGGWGTPTKETAVAFLKKLAKAGVAKKLIDEARKPQNQQRAKDALRKVRNRPAGSKAR